MKSSRIPAESVSNIPNAVLQKYSRGRGLTKKAVQHSLDRKAKGLVLKNEDKIRTTAELAARSRVLHTVSAGHIEVENDMERTYKVKQSALIKHAPIINASKVLDIGFPRTNGPYVLDYTRNGKYMIIGGQRSGHLAAFDWKTGHLYHETYLKGEKIYDVQWLHNESLYAVAQSNFVYIYDNSGTEVHSLKLHVGARHLNFLPFHLLLTSAGKTGVLRYQDITTGVLVNEIKTRLGETLCMAQNRSNAILHLGNSNGSVTLWSPNMGTPLVKMLCHRGPVRSISIERSGTYMATAGLDDQVKLWDIRNYKILECYKSSVAASSVAFSDLGLLAVTYGSNVNIWKDSYRSKQLSPYMTHVIPNGLMHDASFCPYDDVLGLGHALGISTILVPGSGEPNFDSFEANPFETKKQRKETEVRSLLEKLSPEMIALDPGYVGQIQDGQNVVLEYNRDMEKKPTHEPGEFAEKGKRSRKSSTFRRYLIRQRNVIDHKKQSIIDCLERQKQDLFENRTRVKKRWNPLDRFSLKL